MKTKTTKLSVLAFLGLGLAVYGQSGKVGINTSNPEATLDVQPSSTNLAGATNEGFIAPKLSKQRVAQTDDPKEGTLVYVDNTSFTTIDGTKDARVAKITEKGYYYYNGTEWVKSTTGSYSEIWKENKFMDGSIFRREVMLPFLDSEGEKRNGITASFQSPDKLNELLFGASAYGLNINRYVNNSNAPSLVFEKNRGTINSPLEVQNGDVLGQILFRVGNPTVNSLGNRNASIMRSYISDYNNINSFSSGISWWTRRSSDIQPRAVMGLLPSGSLGIGYTLDHGLLQVASHDDVSLGAIFVPFIIGRYDQENLAMDKNEIMARNNGQVSGLHLQVEGGDLTIWDRLSNSEKVKFTDGKMGIGIVAPTEKLEVAGNVKATGFIGANAAIFPDYVFQKYYTGTSSLKADYNFKTLSQVEDFVKTNGYLPGYQSAAEIKKQGYIDIMATQLTNVEKIEELYLHSIEQDKALKAKDAEIKELKERLSKIETLLSK
ncbi:hypothetical protein [Riemerella anatipestifer]|uniref:hypothetical protein n=1 Tax=Riemerella anatipestifer TaxID=34085 RepID=UPI001BD9B8EA|nr:hypothetical protein [Riemerella anatipestifer]MBT0550900.1 hypothetical protein [Riemerella anatipestifer]MCE3023743.1 hypothetical protein [Riemerella anatipestifer]MCU7541815.1 hypothetical protein [Riemerella anatipestifer]MCU7559606.1 hypothetical protein [Riemerella anatipestifer]MCW0512281.1 hypothetical protein [Riemerella anatipestifer]